MAANYGGGGAPAPRFSTVAEAAQAQNAEAVMELLSQGQSVNGQDLDGNTALHWAAWFKLDPLLSQLLERNARPDVGNSAGETPVHWAAKSSNVHALDVMTKADRGLLSQRDCDGFTPFIISAQNDNAPVMEWMYLKGASIEEQDDWGRTALQWACYKGHRRTVQWLLSRSANIAHRDLEGMTAVHWAALKGHEQAAEMLLDVGAVHLLDVPDAAGDTPIALAQRKKNRYLVMCFHKCQLLQFLIGRPHISHNHFANLFVCFMALNILVFAFVMAPGIAREHPAAVVLWSLQIGGSLLLWVQNCFADPGWIQRRTIFPQHHRIGDDPVLSFDADQPVESQMVHHDAIAQELAERDMDGEDSEGQYFGLLERLELEQSKFNYQRQLITEARKRLGGDGPAVAGASPEMQPLMNPPTALQDQLDRAAVVLRERELVTAESIGRARMERLLAQGCGDYLSLLDKGEFKQVCVVCRARRKMRSHHCKECGRCVERLDHHCPWIDNCVGLGNQRSFYCFIVLLFATILSFYYIVVLYAVDVVFPRLASSSVTYVLDSVSSMEFGAQILGPILVILMAAFDLVWLAFVGALVCRHTAYMFVNITTYEYLVRPAHVQRRFPKNRGRFWFFQGFNVMSCIRNVINYWTLNTDQDAADFGFGPQQDSFVAPPGGPGSARRGDDDFDPSKSAQGQGGYGLYPGQPKYQDTHAGASSVMSSDGQMWQHQQHHQQHNVGAGWGPNAPGY